MLHVYSKKNDDVINLSAVLDVVTEYNPFHSIVTQRTDVKKAAWVGGRCLWMVSDEKTELEVPSEFYLVWTDLTVYLCLACLSSFRVDA